MSQHLPYLVLMCSDSVFIYLFIWMKAPQTAKKSQTNNNKDKNPTVSQVKSHSVFPVFPHWKMLWEPLLLLQDWYC